MSNEPIIYLNHAYLPLNAATLSVQDRGFRLGDGLFETIAVHGGIAYQWDFHLQRLRLGLQTLAISLIEPDWQSIFSTLIADNHGSNGFIRIAISRGVGSRGYLPTEDAAPTLLIEYMPRSAESPTSLTIHLSDWRKPSPDAIPNSFKTANSLNAMLALMDARSRGADEALQLNQQGELCELSSGNLFWIRDGQIITPPLSGGCLNGSTRHAIMRLAPVVETSASIEALFDAECVFASNCNWGIMPVSSLLSHGKHWPTHHLLLTELQTAYSRDIDQHCHDRMVP